MMKKSNYKVIYPVKIATNFKNYDKEKLVVVATLQEREIERRAE